MDETWLTYRQSAHRVHRTIRTIRRWKKNGMPTILRGGIRYVEEETLLSWWRQRLRADPVHQQRLRARRNANGSGSAEAQVNAKENDAGHARKEQHPLAGNLAVRKDRR